MFRRRRYLKRKAPARRRYGRRRVGLRRGAYRMSKIYRFKRVNNACIMQNSTTQGVITTNDASQLVLGSTTADTVGWKFGTAMSFRLDQIQAASDFTQLYDQYKIRGVKVTIIPTSDSATTNSSGYLPTMYWCQDQDDSSVPTEAQIRQKQNVKFTRLTGPRSIYVKWPKAQVDVLQSGTTMAPVGAGSPWINCDNAIIQHNGLKMWFYNVDLRAQPSTTTAYRFECTYYLQFKNPQ